MADSFTSQNPRESHGPAGPAPMVKKSMRRGSARSSTDQLIKMPSGKMSLEPSQSRMSFVMGRGSDPAQSSRFSLNAGEERKKPRIKAVNPEDKRYMVWWYFVIAVALWSAVLEPFDVSFGTTEGFSPYNNFWALNIFITTFIFFVDILSKFFVAFYDDSEVLVTNLSAIAGNYMKKLFWFDMVFAFPIDGIIMAMMGGPGSVSEQTAMYISLLRYLKLGRLYRIFNFFALLDHSMVLSQMGLVLLRNNTYVFFTAHWFACIIWFIGRIELMNEKDSWIGRASERFDGQSTIIKYVYSLYYSVNMLTGVGDGDFYCASPLESFVMILYLIFNVVLNAYILGTITMLVVKGDERSKAFRDRVTTLRQYAKINDIPDELVDAMREHLELFFRTEQTQDNKVLDIYPIAITRKLLRHLYLQPVQQCYLFKETKAKFLDELLAISNVELFMPHVQIMVEGDYMPDLCVIVDGEVEVFGMGKTPSRCKGNWDDSKSGKSYIKGGNNSRGASKSGMSSGNGGFSQNGGVSGGGVSGGGVSGGGASTSSAQNYMTNRRTKSDSFGEIAFFTENPSSESAWTCSVVRVLQLPKEPFEAVCNKFPQMGRMVLTNLETRASAGMLRTIWDAVTNSPGASDEIRERSAELMLMDNVDKFIMEDFGTELVGEIKNILPPTELPKFEHLLQIGETISKYGNKHILKRVPELLSAAAAGDMGVLNSLMELEVPADTVDYDKRTALMLACNRGQLEAATLLLECGADSFMDDCYGNTAMLEAIEQGHESMVDLLLEYGAELGVVTAVEVFFVLNSISANDLSKTTMYLRASANPNVANGDDRTGLHLACSMNEESVQMVELLLQYKAEPSIKDTVGRTCLFEATIRNYQASMNALLGAGASLGLDDWEAAHYLQDCVLSGSDDQLRLFLHAGANPSAADPDSFTALHLAARQGSMAAAKLLVTYGANTQAKDAWGNTPLAVAEKAANIPVAEYLRGNPSKDETLIQHLSLNLIKEASTVAASRQKSNQKDDKNRMSKQKGKSRRTSLLLKASNAGSIPQAQTSPCIPEFANARGSYSLLYNFQTMPLGIEKSTPPAAEDSTASLSAEASQPTGLNHRSLAMENDGSPSASSPTPANAMLVAALMGQEDSALVGERETISPDDSAKMDSTEVSGSTPREARLTDDQLAAYESPTPRSPGPNEMNVMMDGVLESARRLSEMQVPSPSPRVRSINRRMLGAGRVGTGTTPPATSPSPTADPGRVSPLTNIIDDVLADLDNPRETNPTLRGVSPGASMSRVDSPLSRLMGTLVDEDDEPTTPSGPSGVAESSPFLSPPAAAASLAGPSIQWRPTSPIYEISGTEETRPPRSSLRLKRGPSFTYPGPLP